MLVLAKAHRVGDHYELEFENQPKRAILGPTGAPRFDGDVPLRLSTDLDEWAEQHWPRWDTLQSGLSA